MAVAAVDTEIAGVKFMAIWHWLLGTIADIGVFRRKIVPDETGYANSDYCGGNRGKSGDFIGPSGENLRQA